MYYIVQENTFREKHYQTLIDTLERFGFEYEIVKFRPFIHQIEFNTTRKDVFCFGATMMSQASMQHDWYPGSLMNANHDIEVYGKHYDMLNADAHVIEVDEPLPLENFVFFARPTKDTKMFTGQLFTQEAWYQWVNQMRQEYLDEGKTISVLQDFKNKSKIFISSVKEIYQEIRCWIVGGNVVSISQYKIGSRVVYENLDHEMEPWNFAQSQVWKYQVADAFCLDICLTSEGYKVVEVNCMSSAGFYEVNMQKLLMALEDHFNAKIRRRNDPTIDDDTDYFNSQVELL